MVAMSKTYDPQIVELQLQQFWAEEQVYSETNQSRRDAARYTLYHALLNLIKLFAPFMPHITEEIYRLHFAQFEEAISIHRSSWPEGDPAWDRADYVAFGLNLLAIAGEVRRFKSANRLSLGAGFAQLILVADNEALETRLRQSRQDIQSVTRAREIVFRPPETTNGATLTPVSQQMALGIVA